MSVITKNKLMEAIKKVNELSYDFGVLNISQTKFSKNQMTVLNPCLSAYLTFNRFKVPRLQNSVSPDTRSYTKYDLDSSGRILSKTIIENSAESPIKYFYRYADDLWIRFGYANRTLREIHICSFENGSLVQIDNAYFHRTGELHMISGEVYGYRNGIMQSCVNYSDFITSYPMLTKRKIMGTEICINPGITEYTLKYGQNGLLEGLIVTGSEKEYKAPDYVSGYFSSLSDLNKRERIVLW